MTHCVIYTRFSPRRHADESESCEIQERLCRDYAAQAGWTVRSVHEDRAISGKTYDRPGLQAAVAALRQGDILLVYRRDRIAREVLLAELTRRQVTAAGATIRAVAGDVEGDAADPTTVFVRQILDAVAELERKQIASRTRDAMHTLQSRGRRMGRYAPYGWALDPRDPSRLVEQFEEQVAIDHIRALSEAGYTPHHVARQMDLDYPGLCRGKAWSARTVRKIAGRPIH